MDLIDKRNMKEKMAKSIIKRRNVIFSVPQETQEKACQEEKADEKKAGQGEKTQEILERLEQRHLLEEERKRKEIERLIEEQENKLQEVNRILNKKQEMLEKAMHEAGMNE